MHKKMFYYAVKRQILYKTPKSILKILGRPNGIEWFYEKILNKNVISANMIDGILAFFSIILSFFTFPFVAVYYSIAIFGEGKVFIPRVEIPVTTFCSLKCRDCSNLMQYYKKPYHIDADDIISDIDTFCRGVFELEQLVILGGEPFLCPELKPILEYSIANKKVKSIKIISNGFFHEINKELLFTLNNPKIRVNISGYGLHKDIVKRNCDIFVNNGVNLLMLSEKPWVSMGDMRKRNRSQIYLKRQFLKCDYKCKCILNGKLYICPRASHGTDLGYFKDNVHFDLRKAGVLSDNEISARICKVYYYDKPIVACDYCDAGTELSKMIPCGIQMDGRSGE